MWEIIYIDIGFYMEVLILLNYREILFIFIH